MRIAAGVLLIVMALVNGIVGGGYLAAGEVATGVGEAVETSAESSASEQAAGKESKEVGGELKAFGAFLLLLCGLEIAAGVTLFKKKAAMFVMVVGALGVAAEVYGITTSGFGLLNGFGILVAAFAFLGAKAIKETATVGARQPAPAMTAG